MNINKLPWQTFADSTCELSKPLNIFLAIYQLSGGRPCIGCGYDLQGKCQARTELFKKPPPQPQVQPETVKEAAARLGVSLSEVRRMRRSAQ